MWRRILCALAIALGACHRAAPPMPDLFPASVGAWHRTAMGEMKPADAPDPVSQSGIERIRAASYEGPGKLDARIYRMSTQAVALDVWQRWQAAPDTVVLYGDRYFVVVRWQSAERQALREFVSALEKKLNAKQ